MLTVDLGVVCYRHHAEATQNQASTRRVLGLARWLHGRRRINWPLLHPKEAAPLSAASVQPERAYGSRHDRREGWDRIRHMHESRERLLVASIRLSRIAKAVRANASIHQRSRQEGAGWAGGRMEKARPRGMHELSGARSALQAGHRSLFGGEVIWRSCGAAWPDSQDDRLLDEPSGRHPIEAQGSAAA